MPGASDSVILNTALDPTNSEPAYMQIFSQIRAFILSGRLSPRQRLPSTRKFAEELGLSRTTLVAAYDQLLSEGYIESKRGAGAYVADYSPDQLLSVTLGQNVREKTVTAPKPAPPPLPFTTGVREESVFPFEYWARLLQKHWRMPTRGLLGQPDPAGDWYLRAAIGEHLRVWRGLTCAPDQIFITSGGSDAADLILRCISVPGDTAYIEDPGYDGVRQVVADRGLVTHYQPVDDEGMEVPDDATSGAGGQVSIVTPSRQFPLGSTMSLARRVALIDWAARMQGWVIEDDYDSEFRYSGRPLAAMMSLDETGRVIYLGSFSNIMFKGLRLGFTVVPPQLAPVVRASLVNHGSSASTIAQPALAEFMSSGQFATHARRLRRLYGRRHAAMLAGLAAHCEGILEPANTPSGMSVAARLHQNVRTRMTDLQAAKKLAEHGLTTIPMSTFYARHEPIHGFILGFSGFDEPTLENGLKNLAKHLA
jgi:GntR family transcriptional regulator/MocR family aminotransferase